MPSPKNRTYFILISLLILGYVWVITMMLKVADSIFTVCPIKAVSGYPCPSCGSTRSVMMLIEGNIAGAINTNPFGIILFLVMLITPFWLIYDWVSKKESLWQFYLKVESFVRRKRVAIFLIILVLANWLWNFNKGL